MASIIPSRQAPHRGLTQAFGYRYVAAIVTFKDQLRAWSKRPWFIGLAVLALLFIVGSLVRHGDKFQEKMVEAMRSDLVFENGVLKLPGEKLPFTGYMNEGYPNGKLKSRTAVLYGVLEGESDGWYTNGQMQVREFFKAGLSEGVRTTWHENGKQATEATIVGGKLNGPYRKWHDNGQLSEQMEMKNGEADGVAISYYPSGYLKARARLIRGKVLEQKFWKDGEQKELPAGMEK